MSITRGLSLVPGVKPSGVAVGIGDAVEGIGVAEDVVAGVACAGVVGAAVCVGALVAVAPPVGVAAAVGFGGRKVNAGCALVHATNANAAIAGRMKTRLMAIALERCRTWFRRR
jgi:hypothetical protein